MRNFICSALVCLEKKNNNNFFQTRSAGVSLQGRMRVDSSFVRSRVDFNIATQVSLNLQSDINFYGGNALCMQLSQPEVVIK